jgi:two-component system sensor histidine kinase YesM
MVIRRRLSKWRNHTRIRTQLSLIGGTVLVLACGLLILYSYLSQKQANEQHETAAMERVIALEGQNLQEYIDDLSSFSLHLRSDFAFLSSLSRDITSDYSSQQYIENMLRQDFYSRQDLIWMELYLVQSHLLLRIDNAGKRVLSQPYQDPETLDDADRFLSAPTYLSVSPDKNGFLRVTRTIINAPQKTPLAVVRFLVGLQVPVSLSESHAKQGEILCLFSTDGTAITDTGKESALFGIVRPESAVLSLQGEQYLAVSQELKELRMIVLKPLALINGAANRTLGMNVLIGLTGLLLMTVILLFSIRHLTRPLSDLSLRIQDIGHGDFRSDAHLQGSQEVTGLSEEVNRMTANLSDLIRQNYLSSLNERTAQLSALEAQINPHFLFNTLQAIGSEALSAGNQDVYRMITALAALLRYTIRGGNLIALSTELEYVRKYLSLQKARFGDRLTFDIRVDEVLLSMEVPKLGLLALAENAITHGMADRTEPLSILIVCRAMPDWADLRVINNGNCIPPEKLKELRDSIREESVDLKKNIGLGNLATRLRLIYGDKACLEITSGSESGQETMVKLIIPREVRRHVQNIDR